MHCTSRWQSYCSCSQAGMAARSRLLSEHHPTFCLVWFAALELFWSSWKQVKPPAVPLSKGMNHLSETLCCVCAEGLTPQQGRVAAFVPFQPSEKHTPDGKAGGHPHQIKSKPVVVIQLWKFPWVQKMAFSSALVHSQVWTLVHKPQSRSDIGVLMSWNSSLKFHKIFRSLSSCFLLWCHSDRLEASSSSVCSPEWYSIRAWVLWVMVTVQGPCAQGSPSTCIGILELFRISWYQTQQHSHSSHTIWNHLLQLQHTFTACPGTNWEQHSRATTHSNTALCIMT